MFEMWRILPSRNTQLLRGKFYGKDIAWLIGTSLMVVAVQFILRHISRRETNS
ncbi:hypothetical protein BDZ91DRAFT_731966 [Kalaharituber pfeilii]|nr:hypothetical protein BDZ91DRAFT_731966 [Kalaharituber pfeilii]